MADEAERVEEYEDDAEEGDDEDESEDFDDSDEGELPAVGMCIVAAMHRVCQRPAAPRCLPLQMMKMKSGFWNRY